MDNQSVKYKRSEADQIASITAHISDRIQILPVISHLRETCGDCATGDPIVIFHGGAVKDGFLIEVAFSVSQPVETGEVHTRILESAPILSMFHHGSHQTIRETVLKIYEYLDAHAWTSSLLRREIYKKVDIDHPENNLTEVQVVLHEWEKLFAQGAENVLGADAARMLASGMETITAETSSSDYIAWIRGAVERLDALNLDDERKCQIVSHCAHVFPQERIDYLRNLYQSGGIDAVLRDMHTDSFWYEKPVRSGNVLYMRKNPYDPEGYKNARTVFERRKAYCHCSFVHPYLDEVSHRLSPTFCFCGAGWYRRLWEGILGLPVKFEHTETLLKGNDQCTFNITLPIEVSGVFLPQTEDGQNS